MGLNGKLKRKDIDLVNDDFSDFSLSSPATKIRRLDSELPPIIEEEEPFVENHEKAIVVFNPLPHHQLRSPSTLSFSLNPDLISGFKNEFLRGSRRKSAELEDETEIEQDNKAKEGCLAVIPWVPSQIPSVESRDETAEQVIDEDSLMEGDEMDVEEGNSNGNNVRSEQGQEQQFAYGYGGLNLKPSEPFLQHWPPPEQQQHCMVPQPPENPFTSPITWSQ